ncbi:hypothetical protein AKJ41_01905 [candidate division MSBL1 archaeon SCGC-AAA259O05]|uniref:Uncharacterized protein n=1 Tax=candidate division MSBL1 archaeon SCGC-AAA259O05 TaxID=1698271 RepID=A0A133V4I9_9EURY|nr:hypothetical protein AKJ41_01905 [candidate division MSBL1 archaeon SCGC-AAA259O05]
MGAHGIVVRELKLEFSPLARRGSFQRFLKSSLMKGGALAVLCRSLRTPSLTPQAEVPRRPVPPSPYFTFPLNTRACGCSAKLTGLRKLLPLKGKSESESERERERQR